MKKLTVLLALAFIPASAFSQGPAGNIVLRGVPTKPRPQVVRMAHKPLVLAKTGALTPADKAQLIASARQAFQKPGAKPQVVPSSQPTTQTITVTQPVVSGGFSMAAYNVGEWDPDNAGLLLNLPFPPNQSNLGFNVVAAPNNL